MSRLIEGLEDRMLLSATLVGKVLTIAGTDNADRVSVIELGTRMFVFESTVTTDAAGHRSVTTNRSTFNRADVESISASLGGGNDALSLNTRGARGDRSALAATVDAGAGNDVVFGGAGNDTIEGGDGNDLLFGRAGNDAVRGGAGNDRISGDGGDDTLEGGDGNDNLFAGRGTDILRGGDGDDVLVSVDGDDKDTVDGGGNTDRGDSAFVDKGDTVSNVEHTREAPVFTRPTV